MRILYVTQFFPPEVGAAANRARNFVKFWLRRGARITVVSEVPNYPTGRISKGYDRDFFRIEHLGEGLDVIRIPVVPTPSGGTIASKLINNISFYIKARHFFNIFRNRNFDIVFATTPPLGCVFLGSFLSDMLGVPLVIDVRDPWPEILLTQDSCGAACRMVVNVIARLMASYYRKAQIIVSPVPFILQHLQKIYSLERTLWIPNGVDLDEAGGIKASSEPPKSRFTVIYSGILGRNHGAEVLLDVIKRMPHVDFWIVGDGKDRPLFEKTDTQNLKYLGVRDWQRTFALVKAADLGIVTLRDNIWMRNAFPVKGIDYLAAGKPVVVSIGGAFPKLLEKYQAGLHSESNDVEQIIASIERIRSDDTLRKSMSINALRLAKDYFDMRRNASRLFDELSELVS